MTPSSRWSDLGRAPLSEERLTRALRQSALWTRVEVVEQTESTNADVAAAAAAGAPEGLVVVAEQQRSGRGRMGRQWESPARAGVLMSMLLRPALPASSLPLLPLLTGVAAAEALRSVAGVEAVLKWPNDVHVGGRKRGGILTERVDGGVVVGIGLNVSTRPDELAVPAATSVELEGGVADREPLVKEVLRALARRYLTFREAGGAPESIMPAYREVCETIGREVIIQLPGGRTTSGTAVAVDDTGMLVVDDGTGEVRAWSAGDVTHVRGGS